MWNPGAVVGAPWYSSPWKGRALAHGPVASVGYLIAGLMSLLLALVADGRWWRLLAVACGALWIFLAVTLLLTMRFRRSDRVRVH